MEAVCLVVGCIKLCWLSIVYGSPQTTLYVKRYYTSTRWRVEETGKEGSDDLRLYFEAWLSTMYIATLGGYCGTFPNSDSSF